MDSPHRCRSSLRLLTGLRQDLQRPNGLAHRRRRDGGAEEPRARFVRPLAGPDHILHAQVFSIVADPASSVDLNIENGRRDPDVLASQIRLAGRVANRRDLAGLHRHGNHRVGVAHDSTANNHSLPSQPICPDAPVLPSHAAFNSQLVYHRRQKIANGRPLSTLIRQALERT